MTGMLHVAICLWMSKHICLSCSYDCSIAVGVRDVAGVGGTLLPSTPLSDFTMLGAG